MKKIAIVRGKFLNRYEMQSFEPLVDRYSLTGFSSLKPFHDQYAFPLVKLPSPMDLPDFPLKMPILNRLFIDAHYLWGLEEKLTGFDLVHTAEMYYHYTQQCLNAKKQGRVKKVIATVLENIPFNNEGIWGRKEFKKRSRDELDHIIALTNKTKDALLAEGTDEKKITVIGHGIDTKRFHPVERAPSSSVTILFCGRFEEYKGIFDVLDAELALTEDTDLDAYHLKFLFVGDGSSYGSFSDREAGYGLDRLVKIQRASYDEMPSIYQSVDIFVAPSLPRIVRVRGKHTKTWDEQYSTVLLEAQASGLPIITTKIGGIPENVGDAAVMVEPGDIQDIYRNLKQFILKPSLRRLYGEKARRRATEIHDVHHIAKRLSAVYEKVLAER